MKKSYKHNTFLIYYVFRKTYWNGFWNSEAIERLLYDNKYIKDINDS
jgi:hypothetical protein